MHKILYRPIIIISLILGLLILAELLALGSITWRNLNRIDNVKADIIQGHELEELVIDLLSNPSVASGKQKNPTPASGEIHKKIAHFFGNRPNLDEGTKLQLEEIKPLLLNIEEGKRQDLGQVLLIAKKILNLQGVNEEKLLTQVYDDSRIELDFAVVIPIAVLLPVLLLGIVYFKRRVLSPLHALEQLLKRLIKGEMQLIEDNNDPLMRPLFNSYNRLIKRLTDLEAEHLTYTQTLEREVRHATHALLEQSHTLARSERLAAVGELAASTAHELRNPLAGIQAAVENVSAECADPDVAQRLQLVSNEIKRLTTKLNELLAYSKQEPELAKSVDIAKLVNELITLLKYQVNENIKLNHTIPPDLTSTLPETEFRQALLNLMLNSVQELGSQGGTVDLTINKIENNLNVQVTDSGHGFPDSLLQHGIRPFSSYREQGTGLGLAMVMRFAKSLGGQLNLKNDSHGHACATLILPLSP